MQLAARRPHITAGVALASAAVIAAGPMTQHLPKLDVAHHLPTVSVTDINLTDAASSMMDLFSGVENELASLAGGGAAAAAVPAAVVNPLQTWVNTFETAGAQLQRIYNNMPAAFPVLQQVAANGVSLGSYYVEQYQSAMAGALTYFLGTTPAGLRFGPIMQTAFNDYLAGNFPGMMSQLYNGLVGEPLIFVLSPLENELKIPAYMTANLATTTDYLATQIIPGFLGGLLTGGMRSAFANIGTSLQAASNAWSAGDLPGAVTNLADIPGAATNGFLNAPSIGMLSTPNGGITKVFDRLLPTLAQDLYNGVASPTGGALTPLPNTTNIAGGGSLLTSLQNFGNQLVYGWPSLTPLVNTLSTNLTSLLQSIPSILSNLPSTLSNIGGWVASQAGMLIASILRLL